MSNLERVKRLSEQSDNYTKASFASMTLALISGAIEIGATIKHNTYLQIISGASLLASGLGFLVSVKVADRKGRKSEELFNSLNIDGPNPYPTHMSPHTGKSNIAKKIESKDPYVH